MKEFENTIISETYKWSNPSCLVVASQASAMPVRKAMIWRSPMAKVAMVYKT